MSAWLRPTCGRAAELFSTLAAITGLPLTLPPVSGSPAFVVGSAVVGEGVGVDVPVTELASAVGSVAGGVPAERLHALTPEASNATDTTAATRHARQRTEVLMPGQILGRTGDTPGGVTRRRAARGTS
jgi:hypothetical protein